VRTLTPKNAPRAAFLKGYSIDFIEPKPHGEYFHLSFFKSSIMVEIIGLRISLCRKSEKDDKIQNVA